MNIRKKLLVFCLLSLLTLSWAQAQIQFAEGDWASIQKMAKENDKHIMVDAFTTWCGPCKWMSANVFTDETLGEFYQENYVAFKLDMEKGEGLDFAKKYGVRAYPTLVFFNPQGEMVHKVVGASPAKTFLVQSKDAMQPEKQLYTLQKKYKAGNTEPDFLRNLAFALQAAYDEQASEVAKKYAATQDDEAWLSEENWEFIRKFSEGISSEPFQFVLDHQENFEEKYGEGEIAKYVLGIINTDLYKVARSGDEEKIASFKKQVKRLVPEEANKYSAKLDYLTHMKSPEAHTYASAYLDSYSDNWQELNSAAWNYFENESDASKLEKALSWAEKSISLNKNFYNTDTQANLLFALERYEEALKAAEVSLAIGKENGEDVAATQKLIEKIKNRSGK